MRNCGCLVSNRPTKNTRPATSIEDSNHVGMDPGLWTNGENPGCSVLTPAIGMLRKQQLISTELHLESSPRFYTSALGSSIVFAPKTGIYRFYLYLGIQPQLYNFFPCQRNEDKSNESNNKLLPPFILTMTALSNNIRSIDDYCPSCTMDKASVRPRFSSAISVEPHMQALILLPELL